MYSDILLILTISAYTTFVLNEVFKATRNMWNDYIYPNGKYECRV